MCCLSPIFTKARQAGVAVQFEDRFPVRPAGRADMERGLQPVAEHVAEVRLDRVGTFGDQHPPADVPGRAGHQPPGTSRLGSRVRAVDVVDGGNSKEITSSR